MRIDLWFFISINYKIDLLFEFIILIIMIVPDIRGSDWGVCPGASIEIESTEFIQIFASLKSCRVSLYLWLL
jgi:hypothetical protein